MAAERNHLATSSKGAVVAVPDPAPDTDAAAAPAPTDAAAAVAAVPVAHQAVEVAQAAAAAAAKSAAPTGSSLKAAKPTTGLGYSKRGSGLGRSKLSSKPLVRTVPAAAPAGKSLPPKSAPQHTNTGPAAASIAPRPVAPKMAMHRPVQKTGCKTSSLNLTAHCCLAFCFRPAVRRDAVRRCPTLPPYC